ncbi:MAG TPA: CAP domain-containing protein [Acidimicrobiales bacterium]
MPTRRPSPARLLLVLLVACLAPVAAVTAAGLAGGPAGDAVETAHGGARGGPGGPGPADRAGSPGDAAAGDDVPGRRPSTAGATAPSTTAAPPTTAPPATPGPTAPPTTAPPTTAPPTTAPPPSATDQVVALANAARADAGCPGLRIDDRLTAAAQGHSDDMAANGYFSHTSLDGRTFVDRVEAAGYPRSSAGGENIAQGQRTAREVHDGWMGSEGHRANILNCSFTAIGVGLNTSAWTWTQNFGY